MLRLTGRAVLVCLSLVGGLNVGVSSELESQAVRKTLSEKDAPFDRSKFPAPWVKPTEEQLERSTQKPRSAGVRDGISLTSQQEQEMASIREKYRKTIKPLLKQAESAEKDAPIRKQIADLIEEQKEAVLSVLTSEQRQRYEINKRRLSALNSFSNEVLASAEVPPLWSSDFSFTKSSGPNADGYSLPLWEIPKASYLATYACDNGIVEIIPCVVHDSSLLTQGGTARVAVRNNSYYDIYVSFDVESVSWGNDFIYSYYVYDPDPYSHILSPWYDKETGVEYWLASSGYSSSTAEFRFIVTDYYYIDKVTSTVFISGYKFKAQPVESIKGESAALCGVYCGDNYYSKSTVGYRSLDIDRNVTLTYNSGTVQPKPVILADLVLNDVFTFAFFIATLKVEGLEVPFTNGRTFHYVVQTSDSARRLGAQFNASTYTTGTYDYELTLTDVLTFLGAGATALIDGKIAVINGLHNPVAKGWDIAGLQRWTGDMIVNGDGSYIAFKPMMYNYSTFAPVNGEDFSIVRLYIWWLL